MQTIAMPCFTRRPRFATSAGTSNLGWSLRGKTSSLMMRRSPCMGSAAVLATVSSSNQVGRKDLTPMAVLELLHLISSRRRLWYTGGTIGWNKHIYVANIPRYIDPSLFKLCRDASHLHRRSRPATLCHNLGTNW